MDRLIPPAWWVLAADPGDTTRVPGLQPPEAPPKFSRMFGGIAIWRNLLCVAYSEVAARVVLIDLDGLRPLSHWSFGEGLRRVAPGGVAFGPHGEVFVTDPHNDCVRWFTAFGKTVGVLGESSDRGPLARERDRPGTLDAPRSVAVIDSMIYVGCGERQLAHGVQRFGLDGDPRAPLRSSGDPERRFGAPRGLFGDSLGLLVADSLNGVVQRFDTEGRFIAEFSTARRAGERSRPVDVLRRPDGDVLVVDGGDDPGLRGFAIDGAPWSGCLHSANECLEHPIALTKDDAGRLYVSDRDGERVCRFSPELEFDGVVFDARHTAEEWAEW